MTGLESTKIYAAILSAGIIAVGAGVFVDILTHREKLAENAYPVVVAATTAAPDAGAEEPMPESVLPLLASADSAAGEKVARKCTACHTFEEGGANKIGPNLWNVVDRDVAVDGSFGYSPALKDKSGESWSYENLDAYLTNPKDWAPGTKMSFAGLKKVKDRANLIGYLRSLSASPAALPDVEETGGEEKAAAEETMTAEAEPAAETASDAAESAETATQTAAAPAGLGGMIAAADSAAGQKVARKCKACHSFDKGGPNKIGPPLWGIVGSAFASHEGFKYSSALAERSGETWSYEALDSFLAKPKDYLPGTKMAFAGLKKPEDRAALLAYLREVSDAPPPLPE